jgi:hypothetical protein
MEKDGLNFPNQGIFKKQKRVDFNVQFAMEIKNHLRKTYGIFQRQTNVGCRN